jgi:hypothetical protein
MATPFWTPVDMSRRKERAFRTEAELLALYAATPTCTPAREALRLSIKYRRDPAMRLDRINRDRRRNGRPEAKSLDEVQRRLD